jgi:hypothetical protein
VIVFATLFAVRGFFTAPRAADRDEAAGVFIAIRHRCSPRGLRYLPNDEEPGIVHWSSREFDAVPVQPQRLRLDEIKAVFRLVRG